MSDRFYWVSVEELVSITSSSVGGEAFNITDISVDRDAKGIMSPVETGTYVFDNKVLVPLTVNLNAIVCEKYWDRVWEVLLRMYENRTYKFYSVITRGELIEDLMLLKMPRKETSEKFDAVDVNLQFAKVVYATERKMKPMVKTHQTTVNTGFKLGRNASSILNTPNFGMTLR